jgi:hypothetical protein
MVIVECISYDGQTPQTEADEYVQLANQGADTADLAGWTLRDVADGRPEFVFPSYPLAPGARVRVYTNETHLQWGGFSFGSRTAIWNNNSTDADAAGLFDPQGREVSQMSYPPGCPGG